MPVNLFHGNVFGRIPAELNRIYRLELEEPLRHPVIWPSNTSSIAPLMMILTQCFIITGDHGVSVLLILDLVADSALSDAICWQLAFPVAC